LAKWEKKSESAINEYQDQYGMKQQIEHIKSCTSHRNTTSLLSFKCSLLPYFVWLKNLCQNMVQHIRY